MPRARPVSPSALGGLAALTFSLVFQVSAVAQIPRDRPAFPYIGPPPAPPGSPGTLGTFVPDPVLIVRGSAPSGTGYTPFQDYGPYNLDQYGPLSAFRAVSVPIQTYATSYDGTTVPVEGISFAYPFRPGASRVVYPAQRSYWNGFRRLSTPPWWPSGINWVDQN